MAQYDAFADFYNRDWGEEYHAQIMSVLDRLLLSDLRPGDSILDLGCGTGTLAARLTARGFVVTGLDQSPAMLSFARRNAPHASFVHADASSFELDTRFTATVATFEAMNHLLDPAELASCFARVLRVTDQCFIFDMNRESAFDVFWNGENTVESNGLYCHLRSAYDPISRLATCRTDVGGDTTTITERYYDSLQILELLTQAGFARVERFDGRRDLQMWGSVAVGRFFYRCFP